MTGGLALIPARGGSKGIPRKNVKLIAGKPLVAHSIIHAKEAPGISRVVVSTDDDEIAAVSRSWGAEVVQRPAEISGDKASSESALLHALDYLKINEGYDPELVVFLQATSPSRQPGEIQAAIDTLAREQADSLLSVGPLHGFVWRAERDGAIRSFSYDHLNRPRRQDAPEDFIENGSLYIFKPWVLRKFNNRLGGRIALHRMSALDSFQIDEPGDFELIEHLMSFQRHPADTALGSGIRLLVLDFDGVMTDNRVLVMENGQEGVLCNRSDGLGIVMLLKKGIDVVVISKEKNPVVTVRCQKLGVPCIQGCDDKLTALKELAATKGLHAQDIAYVGNDVNDLECMNWVGLPIAVNDAYPEARSAARWITAAAGGHGAVREVCNRLLQSA